LNNPLFSFNPLASKGLKKQSETLRNHPAIIFYGQNISQGASRQKAKVLYPAEKSVF
jgi:hypothetical protein